MTENDMTSRKLVEWSRVLRAALLCGTVSTAGPALAQQTAPAPAAGATLEEVVVTAQKREQTLQSVPVSITALTGADLVANRVADVRDLSAIAPNLTVRTGAGGAAFPVYSLRGVLTSGISPGQDKGVSLYLDGVYLQNTLGSIFDLADVERIEVLKGPQGTLFGRNATGGAISIITHDPKGVFDARQEFTAGNFNQFRSKTRIDLPAWGPFSAAVTYLHSERRGDVRNLGAGTQWNYGPSTNGQLGVLTSPNYLGDEDVNAVTTAIKFSPWDKFDLTYKFDYAENHFTAEAYAPAALNTALLGPLGALIDAELATQPNPARLTQITKNRPDAVNNAFTVPSRVKNEGHNLTASYFVTDNISIKNILSFREDSVRASTQLDGLGGLVNTIPLFGPVGAPFLLLANESSTNENQWSNETQLNVATRWFQLTAGVIHFHDDASTGPIGEGPNLILFGLTPNFVVPNVGGRLTHVVTNSDAVFAQPEIHLTSKLDFVVGARATRDHKKGVDNGSLAVGPLPINYESTRPTYLVGLNYQPNDDALLYAKFSTGYISGGFLGTRSYSPETSRSYEVGVKQDLLERRLRMDIAAYHVDYSALQYATTGLEIGLPAISQVIINGGDAKADGFEFESSAIPVERLTLTANVGYTDFRYTSVNPVLSPSVSAYLPIDRPRWTSNVAVQYETPDLVGGGRLVMRADASYQSKTYLAFNLSTPQSFENTITPGTVLLNGRIALSSLKLVGSKAEVALWGRNLTNNRQLSTVTSGNFLFAGSFQRARTFGVDVNFDF